MKELQASQSRLQKIIQSAVHSCVSSSENIKILKERKPVTEVTEASLLNLPTPASTVTGKKKKKYVDTCICRCC